MALSPGFPGCITGMFTVMWEDGLSEGMTIHEEGTRMGLILQLGKPRLTEVKELAWGHSANESQDWDLPDRAPVGTSRPWAVGLDGREGAWLRPSPCCPRLQKQWTRKSKGQMYYVGWS